MDGDEVDGGPDLNIAPDGQDGGAAPAADAAAPPAADDGLPGYPVDGNSGWRAGVFSSPNLLCLVKIDDPPRAAATRV